MNKDLEQLIKSPFLTNKEQQSLFTILEKDGETELFYQKLQEMLEKGIKKQVSVAKESLERFEEESKKAKEEMKQEKERILQEMDQKLAKIDINDLTLHTQVYESYYEQVFALYRKLEDKMRNIAAKILTEQIKTAD